MNPLEQLIIDRIKKEGPITFEAFMEMALYYPVHGYYSSPETTIGRGGDFYTSPHLHPVFGAMICKQLMEMWTIMGRPFEFHAVEIGAGIGYLCKDIFDYFVPYGYVFYKIFPRELRHVSRYDQRLENFQYQNWVAMAPDVMGNSL